MATDLNTITVGGVTYSKTDYDAMQSSTTTNRMNDALDKDAFLQLLVTQMQYQDPLDPQDNSEYVAQLAQFSALEQMTNVYKSVEEVSQLVSNIDTSVLVGQLSNMIGKDIAWTQETVQTDASGKAIVDANGNAVTTSVDYVGTVKGVNIVNGSPMIIAEYNGQNYQVAIKDVRQVGESQL
ncbi:MAG: flagellar biosynthesis protein FlgD [Schwartzia sp.]|nr:flagellar biosynthesis protein FlgD [Schwartzia sp. (in: firmicutes)]